MADLFDPVAKVEAARRTSVLIGSVASVRADGGKRFALGDAMLRPLTHDEIATLVRLGNSAQDWSRVEVADGFDPQSVRSSSFFGDVVLGRFQRTVKLSPGLEIPAGIYHSTVANSVVGHDALVRDVKLLVNYVVAPGAVVCDCGRVVCEGETSFGNGVELPVAIETGGREVLAFAEIDVAVAAAVARSRRDREMLQRYVAAVAEYVAEARSARGIVERGASVLHTPTVRNTYVGPHAMLDGATLVADTTLLSDEAEPVHVDSGACLKSSLVQWGCHVATMAIVDGSVLTEHSHVERHGKVSGSLLGPNTGVAEGEVTACLLGPFVGFHHQALLIAALWPEGKGNVGYGANVGSNHTSKAPDQEFWPGEGAFLGLGVNIKYPADLSRAPYTIIASGVTTLPQKVTFPFSLINSPWSSYPDISPAYNEIIPAWLLTDNMFTLKRNEGKYKARNMAKRTAFVFDVFRPDTVDQMRDASRRLEAVRHVKEVYTDRDINGLGKNFMLETCRKPAIDAYRFYTQLYALLGLMEQARSAERAGLRESAQRLLAAPSDQPIWEHQRHILHDEMSLTDAASGLRQLPTMLERVARDVERSKAKDDERGARIIDDYADVHAPAAQDKFVKQTWEATQRQVREVEDLVAALS